jgi:hypothetical protein
MEIGVYVSVFGILLAMRMYLWVCLYVIADSTQTGVCEIRDECMT